MARKPKISDEDAELFREAIRGITPLHHDRVETSTNKRQAGRSRRHSSTELPRRDSDFSDAYEPAAPVESTESLYFSRTGLQNSVLRKLRRGQFRIEADLDLHGMTVDQAREALAVFLQDCLQHRKRWLLIIHGKGHRSQSNYPVLKTRLNSWLQQYENVLAFCSARPADGGTGAVYVLIKLLP